MSGVDAAMGDTLPRRYEPGEASALAGEGRRHVRAGDWEQARRCFATAFEADPAQWWLAVDALRAGRQAARAAEPLVGDPPAQPVDERAVGRRTTLLFYPDFSVNNRYQVHLYAEAAGQGVEIVPMRTLAIDANLCRALASRRVVFHQHWVHPVYQPVRHDETAAQRALTRHLSLLRALRSFGCRLLWTLHNLADHDAGEIEQRLSLRAARGMLELADTLLVHDASAVAALAAWTGQAVQRPWRVVPHPLYDDLLARPRRWPTDLGLRPGPPAPDDGVGTRHADECRWLLMVGRLSPYKGGHELLEALDRVATGPAADRLQVVMAGRTTDAPLLGAARRLQSRRPGLVHMLPRRLDDDELGALVERAAVVVTPYRAVLTSGTYFLAATFGKPVLAPRTGMFETCVRHGLDGLLYDGTVEGLARALEQVAFMPTEVLTAMGQRAHARNAGQTIAAVGRRFVDEALAPDPAG